MFLQQHAAAWTSSSIVGSQVVTRPKRRFVSRAFQRARIFALCVVGFDVKTERKVWS